MIFTARDDSHIILSAFALLAGVGIMLSPESAWTAAGATDNGGVSMMAIGGTLLTSVGVAALVASLHGLSTRGVAGAATLGYIVGVPIAAQITHSWESLIGAAASAVLVALIMRAVTKNEEP